MMIQLQNFSLTRGHHVVGEFFFDGLIVSECQCESTLRASQTSGTLDDFAANRAESFKLTSDR